MKKYFNESFKHFLHGGDYNPEQWIDTKEVWDEDMRLMKLSHCNEMSVGIFSWSILEPKENEYDFSFMDEILDKIYEAGGRVLLATPSGARPRWMAEKYPEVLRVKSNGQRNEFGRRHNHCLTSPYYRKKVYEMNSILAKRYGKHPAVIGWHVSNEYGGECFCPLCREAFTKWLENKYEGDINKLNFQWWTTFWSHRFDDFSQVAPPLPHGDSYASLELDWRRFVSDQTQSFIANEIAGIREYSDLPTTINMMPYQPINYTKIATEIDAVSWDSFPSWHKPEHLSLAPEIAFWHDFFRSMKQKPFLLMESTPSNTNWQEYNKLKRPGMHKLSSIQAVAHGSDSVQYFQWRKSRGSNEKFHGAVVDHVGHENTRVFKDVTELGICLEKINEILGTMPSVKVALVYDVDNDNALKVAQGFQLKDKKYVKACLTWYNQFWKRGIDVDVVNAEADLSSYSLVVAPMLYSTSEKAVANIENYVKNGGTYVGTYALAMVNENDLCYLGGFPANNLKNVFGVWAEEIDTLYPGECNYVRCKNKEYKVVEYCERLNVAPTAKVIGTYQDDFYANEPAIVKNAYEKGTAYYVGARGTGELEDSVIATILKDLKIEGNVKKLPEGVTAHSREDENAKYIFVENYNGDKKIVDIGEEMLNLETGEKEKGEIVIPAFGLKILKKTK